MAVLGRVLTSPWENTLAHGVANNNRVIINVFIIISIVKTVADKTESLDLNWGWAQMARIDKKIRGPTDRG